MPHLRPGSQVSKSIKKKEEEFILYLHHPSETKATTRVPPSVLCIVFLIYIFQKATLGSQQRWVKSTRRVLIIPMYPLSPQHIASSTVYIPSHGGALVTLVNLHWLFIIPKVHVYIRVHFSAVHLMGLDKCIMTCIHPYNMVQNRSTALKILSLPLLLTPLSPSPWQPLILLLSP